MVTVGTIVAYGLADVKRIGCIVLQFPKQVNLKNQNGKIMNVFKKSILLGSCVAALTLGGNRVMAQGRFDPAQFKQMRIDRARDQLEVKDDAEWKAIEPLVSNVIDAETDVMRMRAGGMFGGGRGGRRGERNGGTNSTSNSDQPRRRSPFGEPSAAVTSLQEAIDNKAPSADIKAKLAAVRAETKDKEAKLDAAQAELKGVLSSRQEAIAVVNGLLK